MNVDTKLKLAVQGLATIPLLHKQDLAQHFGVTERTIRDWVRAGKLPRPIRPTGKTPYWHAHDILALEFRAK